MKNIVFNCRNWGVSINALYMYMIEYSLSSRISGVAS